MAQRGGRRKPTALLEANGTLKHNKKMYADRANEPTPPPMTTKEAPSWLSPIATEHWPKFREIADEMRVLTEADAMALTMLAEAFAEWYHVVQAKTALAVTSKTYSKLERTHDAAHRKLLGMLSEFGMTPLARSRLSALPKPPKENKFGLMAGRRQPTKGAADEARA